MNKLKYVLLGALISAVIGAGVVFPTLSWLSSKSDVVVNTFEGGQIRITLDESKVDENGRKTVGSDERVSENSYRFIAGSVFDKDPTPTVLKGSINSYVFAYVENENEDIFLLDVDSENWLRIAEQDGKALYAYKQRVDASKSGEDIRLAPVFTTVTVSEELTGERLDDMRAVSEKQFIRVQAYAIQAEGIERETAIDIAVEQFGFDGDINYAEIA